MSQHLSQWFGFLAWSPDSLAMPFMFLSVTHLLRYGEGKSVFLCIKKSAYFVLIITAAVAFQAEATAAPAPTLPGAPSAPPPPAVRDGSDSVLAVLQSPPCCNR